MSLLTYPDPEFGSLLDRRLTRSNFPRSLCWRRGQLLERVDIQDSRGFENLNSSPFLDGSFGCRGFVWFYRTINGSGWRRIDPASSVILAGRGRQPPVRGGGSAACADGLAVA